MLVLTFPAGVTEINSRIAVRKEAGTVWYINGHLPVFQHAEEDVRSLRMFTSQMIAGGPLRQVRNPAQRLQDILDNIDSIAGFTAGMSFAEFARDSKTVYAVTRALGRRW